MKLKYIVPIFIVFLSYLSCNNDDDNPADNFDAAEQAILDDASLLAYLNSHYYIEAQNNEVFGIIDTIMNNEISLFDSGKLEIQNITENEIDYKLYYYVNNLGANKSPEKTDSVLVNYRGVLLDSTKFDERLSYTWLSLTSVIRGWSHGFVNFKDGDNVSQQGEPLAFENTGNGILFIPSGLAYGNFGTSGIGPNEPLVFFIKLGLVERADHDNDKVFSNFEDIDGDGNPNNDDTDGDTVPDYLDIDDDGDGVNTVDELGFEEYVINIGDNDPVFASNEHELNRVVDNDANTITISTVIFIDSNNDNTPDYLDPDSN